MVINRRRFLLSLSATALYPLNAQAFPMDRILGFPPSDFVQHYLRRYWQWYQKQWFAFSTQMSAEEKALFEYWIRQVPSFGQELKKGCYVEAFLTRHHLTEESALHGRYYAGLSQWTDRGLSLLHKFLQSCGIQHPRTIGSFYGWSHDFTENHIRLWFKQPREGGFFNEQQNHNPFLGYIEYRQGLETKRGVVFHPPLEKQVLPASVARELVIQAYVVLDNQGKQSQKLRTRGTHLASLHRRLPWVAAQHKKEFKQIADFYSLDEGKELKVYYP